MSDTSGSSKNLNRSIYQTASIPAAKVVAPRPEPSRKVAPIILGLCVLLAVAAVLLIPSIVGGATGSSASQAVAFAATADAKQFESLAAAAEAISFEAHVPTALPEGAAPVAFRVLDGEMLEVEYKVDRSTVVYRTAPGKNDLTFDATEYSYMATIEGADGVTRSYAGTSDQKLALAMWASDGQSYALVASGGIEAETLCLLAESIT